MVDMVDSLVLQVSVLFSVPNILVFHLTIADSLVSFITMPLEAGWRLTMQWMLDDLSCRVLMVVRALGYYLSSNILVIICIDRSGFGGIFDLFCGGFGGRG